MWANKAVHLSREPAIQLLFIVCTMYNVQVHALAVIGTVNTAAPREEVQFHRDLATIQWVESAHLKHIMHREPREDKGQVLYTDLDADWLHVS